MLVFHAISRGGVESLCEFPPSMRACCGLQFYEGRNVGHANVGGPQALFSVSRACKLYSSSLSPASAPELSEWPFLLCCSHVDAEKVVFFMFSSGILGLISEREGAGPET